MALQRNCCTRNHKQEFFGRGTEKEADKNAWKGFSFLLLSFFLLLANQAMKRHADKKLNSRHISAKNFLQTSAV